MLRGSGWVISREAGDGKEREDQDCGEGKGTHMTNNLALVHDIHLSITKNDPPRLECILNLHTHTHTHTWLMRATLRLQSFVQKGGLATVQIVHATAHKTLTPASDSSSTDAASILSTLDQQF